ncbi:nucleotide exchange factor GrpE [Candidatus Peregrinibacteria bacterium]|nr:nucleotide exchange factor GrpE [Candidatus Peregrinibacteria bacterium]
MTDPKDDDLKKKVEEAKAEDEKQNAVETQHAASEQQVADLKDQLARCLADMQNMKRRAEEDKFRFVKFANAEMLKTLLPIIDNFDRACQHLPETLKTDEWAKGVISTHDELMKALEKLGVKRVPTVGEKLDPTRHEAMLSDKGEKDVVLEELEPGYLYHDETLKPAKVKVGNGS